MRNPFKFEGRLWEAGYDRVAGIDEVGRGCLAGPVVAAAVVLPPWCTISGVDDSKQLAPAVRELLYDTIVRAAIAYSIGMVDPVEIDRINILQATRKAMAIAVANLSLSPQHLLIDGPASIPVSLPQTTVVKGDQRSQTIAAASIIAKVTRDRMLVHYEREYPRFRFSAHKGYGTEGHLAELRAHGVTPIHRRSFAPCTLVPSQLSDG